MTDGYTSGLTSGNVNAVPRTRRRSPATTRERRRERERSIVLAARAILDQRARREVSVHEIARAAGIGKPLVYRSFESKEEILAVVLTDYLQELAEERQTLPREDDGTASGAEGALRAVCALYADFCLEYPAFLDCALALMQRPAIELREEISGARWARLGGAVAGATGAVAQILAAGAEEGVFATTDPDLLAGRICVQMLGTMHLARVGLGIRELAPGVGQPFEIDPGEVCAACVDDALALARAPAPAAAG